MPVSEAKGGGATGSEGKGCQLCPELVVRHVPSCYTEHKPATSTVEANGKMKPMVIVNYKKYVSWVDHNNNNIFICNHT